MTGQIGQISAINLYFCCFTVIKKNISILIIKIFSKSTVYFTFNHLLDIICPSLNWTIIIIKTVLQNRSSICKAGKPFLQWADIISFYCLFLSVIDIQAFERLLGPCMDIMKRNISQYEDQLVALFGSSVDLKH